MEEMATVSLVNLNVLGESECQRIPLAYVLGNL